MTRYYRKVIRIRAEDSPNVRLGLAQRAQGREPTGETLFDGVLPWHDYVKRRATWDDPRQCVGLDAMFWEGKDVLMFPPDWLNRAERDEHVRQCRNHPTEAIGVDVGEGVANTVWSGVNRFGLRWQVSKKTNDTDVIPGDTIAFMNRHGVAAEDVMFDRGGGGKEHADRLRARGHDVRTVAFGESPTHDLHRGIVFFEERTADREDRTVFKNRRAQMYYDLRVLLDPCREVPFALPPEYAELRRQLAPIPLLTDEDGKRIMLPKNKRNKEDKRLTLTELLGCSPDEADSVVIAVHALLHKAIIPEATFL